MDFQGVMQSGEQVMPSFELPLPTGRIAGIQLDAQRKKLVLGQLGTMPDVYISQMEQGEYTRLTVEELLRFLKAMSGVDRPVSELVKQFHLEEVQKTRIGNLPLTKKAYVSLLRIWFAKQGAVVLEEPYFWLEEAERRAFAWVLERLAAEKAVIIITSNLEDALVSCDDIYRLDGEGLHPLDIADEEEASADVRDEADFRIQKIPTKKNGKAILFNPPEIDYIESVNSTALVHVGGETYTCQMTLAELEERLVHYGFFRCHRSYIVNLQKVRELITWTKNSYSLRLSAGKDSVVPLSRTKLAELKGLLHI